MLIFHKSIKIYYINKLELVNPTFNIEVITFFKKLSKMPTNIALR